MDIIQLFKNKGYWCWASQEEAFPLPAEGCTQSGGGPMSEAFEIDLRCCPWTSAALCLSSPYKLPEAAVSAAGLWALPSAWQFGIHYLGFPCSSISCPVDAATITTFSVCVCFCFVFSSRTKRTVNDVFITRTLIKDDRPRGSYVYTKMVVRTFLCEVKDIS